MKKAPYSLASSPSLIFVLQEEGLPLSIQQFRVPWRAGTHRFFWKPWPSLNFMFLHIPRRGSLKPRPTQPPTHPVKKWQQNILLPGTHKSVAVTIRKGRSPSGPELPSHSCSVGKDAAEAASGSEFWSFRWYGRHWLLGTLGAW